MEKKTDLADYHRPENIGLNRPSSREINLAFTKMITEHPEVLESQAKNKQVPEIKSMTSIAAEVEKKAKQSDESKLAYLMNKLSMINEGAREKKEGLETLEKLDLPRYKKCTVTIADFLSDPDLYFDLLKTKKYFPNLINRQTKNRRFRLGYDRLQTIKFVEQSLEENGGEFSSGDTIILSEFRENAYSGNIIINPAVINGNPLHPSNRNIKIEAIKGEHANLAYGNVSAEVIITINSIDEASSNKKDNLIQVSLTSREFSDNLVKRITADKASQSYADFKVLKKVFEEDRFYNLFTSEEDREKDFEILCYYEDLIGRMTSTLELIPKDQKNETNFSVIDEKFYHPGYYEFIIDPEESVSILDHRKADKYSDYQINRASEDETGD